MSEERLRRLRNIDVERVAMWAGLQAAPRSGRRRFVCPLCRGRHTTLESRRNLARCFRCERSFNAIDLVIAASGYSFLRSLEYLEATFEDR